MNPRPKKWKTREASSSENWSYPDVLISTNEDSEDESWSYPDALSTTDELP